MVFSVRVSLWDNMAPFFPTISPSPLEPPRGFRNLLAIAFSPLQSNEKKFVDGLF
jgi:hypothetical protein